MGKIRKSLAKNMYCEVCNKWLTKVYWTRHLNCKQHLKKQEKHDLSNVVDDHNNTIANAENSEKSYVHYQFVDNTLEECPHNHKNIFLEGCDYFKYKTSSQNDGNNSFKLFGKEGEGQCQFDEIPQALDFDWDTYVENEDDTVATSSTVPKQQIPCSGNHFYQIEHLMCTDCNPAGYKEWIHCSNETPHVSNNTSYDTRNHTNKLCM